jgi:hypothetical protein
MNFAMAQTLAVFLGFGRKVSKDWKNQPAATQLLSKHWKVGYIA